MNTNKTKFLNISKGNIIGAHISVNQTEIKRLHCYQYLGTVIHVQWDNAEEIKYWIENPEVYLIQ